MTPERWQQIDSLLQGALDHPVEEFEARLNRSCAGDESLRQEVESLIRYRKLAESFLEEPVLEAVAELLSEGRIDAIIGSRIGPYKIEGHLGAGGMAEVYLAEDTKLDRKVAIKFLPPYLEADNVAKKRLLREARAAARLDHPNICSIYEIAEEDGRSYIVMQYVEGETLSSRLKHKTLDWRESTDIACQTADALAEAHSQGIIHRDIKPQNVMLSPRGQVKVLDFGLAKSVAVEGRNQSNTDTETLLSVPGLIVGTAPYMSPEQAKGTGVDAQRSLLARRAALRMRYRPASLFGGNRDGNPGAGNSCSPFSSFPCESWCAAGVRRSHPEGHRERTESALSICRRFPKRPASAARGSPL